jgi:hypothetical protein
LENSIGSILKGELTMKKGTVAVSAVLLLAVVAWAQETRTPQKKASTPAALKAEIESLKSPRVAWREIAWKSCLIDGLKESRQKKKPVLLWVFIDRPIDDARC